MVRRQPPKIWSTRRFRNWTRWLVLILGVILAWPFRKADLLVVQLPALSPYVGVNGMIVARTVGILGLTMLPVLLLVIFLPRWVCRYGCPVGFLQELLGRWRFFKAKPRLRIPDIGSWIALCSLGGAFFGFPIFMWLDPLAIFNGFFNAWRLPLSVVSLIGGIGLPVLLVFDYFIPHLWCKRLCPLGGAQDLLTWSRRRLQAPFRASASEKKALSAPPGRRHFLMLCLGAVGTLALKPLTRPAAPPLRPPGALDEPRFTDVCVRCGDCSRACPSKIIQPDLGQTGLLGFLTPKLSFEKDYCHEGCNRCSEVCPSGAIVRYSLLDKARQNIGKAVVNVDTCLLANGHECSACIQHCPYDAILLKSFDGGFTTQPSVILDKCTGCGACEADCPVRPQRAIYVTLKDTRLKT